MAEEKEPPQVSEAKRFIEEVGTIPIPIRELMELGDYLAGDNAVLNYPPIVKYRIIDRFQAHLDQARKAWKEAKNEKASPAVDPGSGPSN